MGNYIPPIVDIPSNLASQKRDASDKPLVSIITPLNGVRYLEMCVNSVLSQSYPFIEHIFIDGGSTDGTLDILAGYQVKYPGRVRLISEPGMGVVDAWNKGFQAAGGLIFGWLGADDMFEPGAIRTVIEFFNDNKDACFVFGDCNIINEIGEIIGKSPTRDFNLKEALSDNLYIPTPSAFYKREVVDRVGYMDTSIEHACDFDYWIRVGKIFKIYRINTVLSNFRIHKDSISGSKGIDKTYVRENFLSSRRHGGSLFSGYARRYYRMVIIEKLRPILGFTYPLISKILRTGLRRERN